MRRFRGFDVESRPPCHLMQPGEDRFEVVRGNQVIQLAAPNGHQKKDAPHGDIERFQQPRHVIKTRQIATGNCGVDLHGQAHFARPANGVERPLIRARNAPKGVVIFRRWPIQAYRQTRQSPPLKLGNRLVRQKRRGAGSQ